MMSDQSDIPEKDWSEFAKGFFTAAWQHAADTGECIYCGGDGICYDCRGWGAAQRENCGPCETCQDSEICQACNGTGIFPPEGDEDEE